MTEMAESFGEYEIRPARPDDEQAVGELLQACYPPLLAGAYDEDLLAAATPALVRANPALLGCGTWYVAESRHGLLTACGGVTAERPDTGEVEAGLGHLRHFGTHPQHVRRGLARAILQRSALEGRRQGLHVLEAYSTLTAEPFYARFGLRRISRMYLPVPVLGTSEDRHGKGVGTTLRFPAILMRGSVKDLLSRG